MKRTNGSRHGGFTLVEMLVVIAIIGILAAILVPTLYMAVTRAKQNKIAQEINTLVIEIETYKQTYGDYPPDCTDATIFTRHLRRAFPRHVEPIDSTTQLPVNSNMTFPDGTSAATLDLAMLDPSEALVFWLGMIKNDKRLPLNGTSTPEPLFPFDVNRLVDLDGDGWLSYIPPDGKDMPYVYFDSRTYSTLIGTDYCHYLDTNGQKVYPYQTDRPQPASASPNPTPGNVFVNEKTFQLISAGLDGEFGLDPYNTANQQPSGPLVAGGSHKIFPSSPEATGLNWSVGDLDNIANFSDGKIFEDRIE